MTRVDTKFLEEIASKDPKNPTRYWCHHGVSNTYPCPDCYGLSPLNPPRDRTLDWKQHWEGVNK